MKNDIQQQIKKESIITILVYMGYFFWWLFFAFGFDYKNVQSYKYIFGFPTWFFYSCILGFILFVLAVIIIVKCFFVEIPFDSEKEEKNEK